MDVKPEEPNFTPALMELFIPVPDAMKYLTTDKVGRTCVNGGGTFKTKNFGARSEKLGN